MAKKWTKKDIKSLCSQLDSVWLFERMYYPSAVICDVIEKNRKKLVINGLRGFQNMARERGQRERETVEHAKTSGVWGNGTQEMIERFTKLAEESEKDVAKIDALVARIELEGLPPEVEAYLPEGLVKMRAHEEKVAKSS